MLSACECVCVLSVYNEWTIWGCMCVGISGCARVYVLFIYIYVCVCVVQIWWWWWWGGCMITVFGLLLFLLRVWFGGSFFRFGLVFSFCSVNLKKQIHLLLFHFAIRLFLLLIQWNYQNYFVISSLGIDLVQKIKWKKWEKCRKKH